MNIIEEVRIEREDLARVLKKHAGIRRIVEELYPDSAHFIYELLQNAEDTAATEVFFTLTRESLVFEHNGRPFTREDIFAITDIGEGTKSGDDDKIGRFGVGFKAVFAYSETPMIWSPTFSFKVSDLVLPSELEQLPNLGNKTRFEFPFNNPKKIPGDAFTEIEVGLNELAETTLLFLSHLNSISWRIDQNPSGDVQRLTHSANHFEVLKRIEGKIIASSHFLKFDQLVAGLEKQRVAVAYALDFLPNVEYFEPKKTLAKQLKIVTANPGCVAVFFPAEKETSGLRFHLHAPFVPELSRASIKETTANQPLFEQLAKLAAASLHKIRALGLLTTEFLAVLPNPQDSVPARYKRIRAAIVEEMNTKPLTPTHVRTHAPARHLLQAKASLKELLSKDDLEILVDYDKKAPMWAIAAGQTNSNIDRFLAGLAITEWDIEKFVEMLCNKMSTSEYPARPPYNLTSQEAFTWLSNKPVEWHQQLYALLYEELCQKNNLSRMNSVQLVRLISGSYSIGRKSFFPSEIVEEDEVLPRVDSRVYLSGKGKKQQENAKNFLFGIGVREVGESEQVEAILMKRYSSDEFNPDIKDLQRFIELVENEPKNAKIFSGYLIFRSSDDKWRKPNEIYLDTPYLETHLTAYYNALGAEADCGALHGSYEKCGITIDRLVSFAKSVGVRTSLKINKVSCHYNPRFNYGILQTSGRESANMLDEDYNIIFIKKAISHKSISLSILIWRSISTFSGKWTEAIYRRNSAWPKYVKPSQLALVLMESEWIPQGNDVYVCPKDASMKLLPKGFPIDKGWEWLKDIGFGENEEKKVQEESRQSEASRQREALARDLGFADEGSLMRAQRFAALSTEQQENILASQERRKTFDLPEHEPSNPEQRASRVGEQAVKAPVRLTEERTRSISIGQEAVKDETAQYLSEQYTNADNEMICQICKAPLPFKLADGSPYFEKVELFRELKKQHYQNYLALCPNHSAMYRHANGSSDEIREMFAEVTGNELPVVLAQKEVAIYFTKTHICDLREILKVDAADGTEAEFEVSGRL
jgi:hypothetical protein